ncbi:hypothetical protein DUNSADRAFT_5027 [Dunaliella salina]|uniref:Chloroplast inner envelope protein n=1 Tax=Dunaliella salina TaxID=3046 RepID=A0ABQ7HAB0_DUNSA|nr:hypothetical protein DUNSADRAFT_5027 [Dunaliella salina]|eukprot:KAF5843790.1 hypothetical protein DUNSADRAFT_5027 [Dunaliella salina]
MLLQRRGSLAPWARGGGASQQVACSARLPTRLRFSSSRIIPGISRQGGRIGSRCQASAEPQQLEGDSVLASFEDPMPTRNKAFPYPMQKDQQQAALSSIPWPLFYPAMAACVGAVGVTGFGAGRALPVEPENKNIASIATAAVGAAAAASVCVQAKKKRDTAAVVDLYNVVVELPDPSELTPQAVDEVGSKYGMKMQKDDLEGLRKIYGQYLETLIPSGDRQLKGDEAAKASSFKTALGLSDEDAAPVHMEVARRLFRQVFVARRDNAKTIFKAIMEREGNELRADRHFLRTLRDHQIAVKMMDESAVELVREFARKHVEARLVKALTQVKLVVTSRDSSVIMDEVSAALDYSRKLARYANEEDLIPGLGFVTLAGGPLLETRARDLKELYKNYIEQRLESTGEFTPAVEADAHDLQQMIKMPQKEAHMLHDEVAARLYKRLLREAVTSGKLDSSESPAEVLGSLCERLRFSPEAALQLHQSAEGPPPSVSEAAAEAGKSNSISEVQKAIQAARGEFGDDEKKGQKEITLKDDVPAESRALLYRDYLMSTMSDGDQQGAWQPV